MLLAFKLAAPKPESLHGAEVAGQCAALWCQQPPTPIASRCSQQVARGVLCLAGAKSRDLGSVTLRLIFL